MLTLKDGNERDQTEVISMPSQNFPEHPEKHSKRVMWCALAASQLVYVWDKTACASSQIKTQAMKEEEERFTRKRLYGSASFLLHVKDKQILLFGKNLI